MIDRQEIREQAREVINLYAPLGVCASSEVARAFLALESLCGELAQVAQDLRGTLVFHRAYFDNGDLPEETRENYRRKIAVADETLSKYKALGISQSERT